MKKYTKITAICALIGICVFSFFACTDEYIDEADLYAIDSETFFNSEKDYYNALVGAYDPLQSTSINVLMGEIASNNTLCGGESATDVPGYQQVDDMIHTPVNAQLKNLWNWMFGGVNRAAYIIEFKDKTDFEGKDIILGEAYFLRAYYNFELVKWFGAIPIKPSGRFSVNDEKSIPRSPVNEVYKLIEEDLKIAIASLSYSAPQVGRATKGSAQALLGKVYLYQDKFDQSAAVLEDLIQNGPFQLESDYKKIFEFSGENGVGSVFEVQYTDVQGAGFGCIQCSEGNVAVGFQGVRGYEGPDFTSGFSFNVPVQEVVDAFEDGDNRKDVAILDIVAWAAATGAEYTTGYEHTGYFNRKYLPRTRSANAAGDLNLTNPNNYRAIRYADVLLMASEAFARKDGPDFGKSQTYLNLVRRRAFGDTNHDITDSGQNLVQAIWKERRVELVGEGHHFFDLVRTGRGTNIPGFVPNKHEVFPIPFEEIQFSQGNWTQNAGY